MGVMTPKKQSSEFFGTTCSGLMGMVTTPALARETHSDRAAAAKVASFILSDLGIFRHLICFRFCKDVDV